MFAGFANSGSGQVQYGGMQQIGLNVSESGIDAHLAVVNGIRFKRYFTGVGANVALGDGNFFQWWTCNFYADGRYYLGDNKRFFGKVNGGVNVITENTGSYYSWQQNKVRKKPGLFGAVGLGYKAKLNSEMYYSFDICYSFTQLRFETEYQGSGTTFLARPSPDLNKPQRFDMRRQAIVLQFGLEFN